jgi:hypothetical protein
MRKNSSDASRLEAAGPGESVMALAATERTLMCPLILAVGASGDLRSPLVSSKVPVDTYGALVSGNKAAVGAFGPGWFAVKEFDRQWGILVDKNGVALLCTDEAVGGGGGRPPTA